MNRRELLLRAVGSVVALVIPLPVPKPTVIRPAVDFLPELWANESLAILEENMVMAKLLHRNFDPIITVYKRVTATPKRKKRHFTANVSSILACAGSGANI